MSATNIPYYNLEEVKENIGEESETPNEDRLRSWGDWVDSKINDKLRYLFEGYTFNLSAADFVSNGFTAADFDSLQDLANAGLEAKFWKETNGQHEELDRWLNKELPQWIRDLTQVPAKTLS